MKVQSFHIKCERYLKLFTTYAYAWKCGVNPPPNSEKLSCLFDTGSDIGIINIDTANRMGLQRSDLMSEYYTAGGSTLADHYMADICLPGGMVFKNQWFRGSDVPIDIIVGMDIMTLGEMSFRYQNPYLEMSFTSDKYDLYLPILGDGLGIKF